MSSGSPRCRVAVVAAQARIKQKPCGGVVGGGTEEGEACIGVRYCGRRRRRRRHNSDARTAQHRRFVVGRQSPPLMMITAMMILLLPLLQVVQPQYCCPGAVVVSGFTTNVHTNLSTRNPITAASSSSPGRICRGAATGRGRRRILRSSLVRAAAARPDDEPNDHRGTKTTSTMIRRRGNDSRPLAAVSATRPVILDGAEWQSFCDNTMKSSSSSSGVAFRDGKSTIASVGHCTVAAGQLGKREDDDDDDDSEEKETAQQQRRRVVGLLREEQRRGNDDDGGPMLLHAAASIPDAISDSRAIATAAFCLSVVAPVVSSLPAIGGGGDDEDYSTALSISHVVILGGNEVAQDAARAFAALGSSHVTVVTTDSKLSFDEDTTTSGSATTIQVLPPAVASEEPDDEDDVPFCQALGQFDAVVDCLGDEVDDALRDEVTVLRLLRERHGCHVYHSVQSRSQRILQREGILFGPGKAKKHVQQFTRSGKREGTVIDPTAAPACLGAVVERLLEAGIVVFDADTKKKKKNPDSNNAPLVRGWSLKDFWEYSTWPQDASTASGVRFGLPVIETKSIWGDEDDEEEEEDIAAVPLSDGIQKLLQYHAQETMPQPEQKQQQGGSNDAVVLNLADIADYQSSVVEPSRTCVLFVSAPFCRTCRSITPAYQRFARQRQQQQQHSDAANNGDALVAFYKTSASGRKGKDLGKALGVDSVPTFCLFRGGRRYGRTLRITKLPSKTLDLAVDYLTRGLDWDDDLFRAVMKREEEEKAKKKRKDNKKKPW